MEKQLSLFDKTALKQGIRMVPRGKRHTRGYTKRSPCYYVQSKSTPTFKKARAAYEAEQNKP